MRALLAAVAALVLWAAPAAAQTFPKFTGFVVDAADVLPPQAEAELTAKLDVLQRDTKRQLVVATVPDLQGYPIEDYGVALLRNWGVGLKDVNNGAILIVAPNERRVRVEVGLGLEPVVTDAFAGRVIADSVLPRFKAGDLPGGVAAGTDALVGQLRASPEEAQARLDAAVKQFDRGRAGGQAGERAGGIEGFPIALAFMVVAFLFLLVPLFLRRSRAGPWGKRYRRRGLDGGDLPILLWTVGNVLSDISRSGGSGGGSGGGGGWGGGGFSGGGGGWGGGGGASGSW